ncbi:hypothetical protein FJ417_13855 [Mesorhizobium sp. B3-1-7]|uniref:hypothetical protein n=1 Tax=Mesorhizobium sp. B3-1-7 TaxID=2589894 RepID=UPI00112A0608|nr:hypothetical protein [Mesorhizobium sp. B3-1-7]TPI60273.1 hypothetical protein FJ417_13855 [Mesorhizobium sp. B3-1-7]
MAIRNIGLVQNLGRMNSTLPGAPLALARDSVRLTDKIEDDDDDVKDVKTFIRALEFVEYMMTGVRPKTDTLR